MDLNSARIAGHRLHRATRIRQFGVHPNNSEGLALGFHEVRRQTGRDDLRSAAQATIPVAYNPNGPSLDPFAI